MQSQQLTRTPAKRPVITSSRGQTRQNHVAAAVSVLGGGLAMLVSTVVAASVAS